MVEYKQIPKIAGGKCCLCKRKLLQRKPAVIYIYDDEMNFKKISERLFYCPFCMVQYASTEIFTHIRINNNGYRAFGFMVNSKSDSATLIENATTFPVNYGRNKKNERVEHPHPGFDTYPVRGNEALTNVYVVSELSEECVICNKKLTTREMPIPVSKSSCVYYKGKCCGEHFLIKPSEKMRQLLNGNQYAKHIKTNFDYFFRNYLLACETLSDKETYSILLLMKPIDKGSKATNELAVIVGNEKREIRSDIQVIDYKAGETRRLLTDVFKRDKKEVDYSDRRYHVYYRKLKDSYADLILDSVVIQSGGGYYSSIKNKRYKLVDVLMYSPYTQKYEIMHATYDSEEYMCFVDISIFQAFISKYGNPGIKIYPPKSNGLYSDFLNEESLLHAFGYTVNQKDNLSDSKRCAILAEVIDLELMQPQAIVRFLSGCADRAGGKHYYEACAKYGHDIEYVKNYKVNPQRFLISQY